MRRISALLTLLVTALVPALARDEYTRDFEKTMPVSAGQRIDIDHRLGSVIVHAHSRQEVVIRATIRTSANSRDQARELAERIQILVDSIPTAVRIRTEYPERRNGRNISFFVNYDIEMPASAPLQVRNAFGNVDISGITTGSDIRNGNGRVRLASVGGGHTVENRFGPVDISDVKGDLMVSNGNGSMDLRGIAGRADVRGTFGSITVSSVGKGLTVSGQNGRVSVTGANGGASVRNSFGMVDVRDVTGDLEVRNANGAITVHNAQGSAMLQTSFGGVDAMGVTGAITVINQNGAVRTSGGKGVNVRTSFGAVEVEGAEGPLDIRDQNGAIRASLVSGKSCQPVRLETAFGKVTLSLPGSAAYDVDARASFGKITSEFPVQVTGINNTNGPSSTLTGKIGNGGCSLTVHNQNGVIEILKAFGR
jgi:DUF4097 and DUF4098 domain-containing protein YvlB